jgi:hypothetical protein
MAENEKPDINPPVQSGPAKKKSKAGIIIIAILVVALVVVIAFFVLKKTSPTLPLATNRIINRSVEDYQASWTLPAEQIFPTQEDSNLSLEGKEVLKLQIPNPGFEFDQNNDNLPDGWEYSGKLGYSSSNCLSRKCLYVNVDNSDQGFLMLNANEIPVREGEIYNATAYVNCLKCEGQGAYLGIAWLKFYPETGTYLEFRRVILPLKNTKGYEPFTIVTEAPEGAEKAIYLVRVHTEGGVVQPLTEFYIDG